MDKNIRKLVLDKLCYSTYCVKAGWSPNEGVKYNAIDIYCCVDGGGCKIKVGLHCPHGIAWDKCLGTIEEFDPADWGPERFERFPMLTDDSLEEYIEDDEEELDELTEKAIRRKRKGRRTDKGTFHGKSRGKYKQKEF